MCGQAERTFAWTYQTCPKRFGNSQDDRRDNAAVVFFFGVFSLRENQPGSRVQMMRAPHPGFPNRLFISGGRPAGPR
jgi:hypothetical protein